MTCEHFLIYLVMVASCNLSGSLVYVAHPFNYIQAIKSITVKPEVGSHSQLIILLSIIYSEATRSKLKIYKI